jgi:DUF1009 family protein
MTGKALGIIAGGGDLPRAIAENVRESGRGVFVLALRGSAEPWVEQYPHEWVALGEVRKAFNALRSGDCGDVVLVGQVERPKFSEIKMDTRAVMLAPRVMAAALKGDDALLRSLVDMFDREGFRVVSVAEAASGLIAGTGPVGKLVPTAEQQSDVALGLKVVHAMGALDVGQAAIICNGLTLSVEAAEGTDKMMNRVLELPEHIRGTEKKPRGVLVKAPKPIQDRKTDLPVVGVQTVKNAQRIGLAGIAIEAGGALIIDRRAVAEAADKAGLFVIGVAPGS